MGKNLIKKDEKNMIENEMENEMEKEIEKIDLTQFMNDNKKKQTHLEKLAHMGVFSEPNNSFFLELTNYIQNGKNPGLKEFSFVNRFLIYPLREIRYIFYPFFIIFKFLFMISITNLQKRAIEELQSEIYQIITNSKEIGTILSLYKWDNVDDKAPLLYGLTHNIDILIYFLKDTEQNNIMTEHIIEITLQKNDLCCLDYPKLLQFCKKKWVLEAVLEKYSELESFKKFITQIILEYAKEPNFVQIYEPIIESEGNNQNVLQQIVNYYQKTGQLDKIVFLLQEFDGFQTNWPSYQRALDLKVSPMDENIRKFMFFYRTFTEMNIFCSRLITFIIKNLKKIDDVPDYIWLDFFKIIKNKIENSNDLNVKKRIVLNDNDFISDLDDEPDLSHLSISNTEKEIEREIDLSFDYDFFSNLSNHKFTIEDTTLPNDLIIQIIAILIKVDKDDQSKTRQFFSKLFK